jgi:hypothetical protein
MPRARNVATLGLGSRRKEGPLGAWLLTVCVSLVVISGQMTSRCRSCLRCCARRPRSSTSTSSDSSSPPSCDTSRHVHYGNKLEITGLFVHHENHGIMSHTACCTLRPPAPRLLHLPLMPAGIVRPTHHHRKESRQMIGQPTIRLVSLTRQGSRSNVPDLASRRVVRVLMALSLSATT